MRVKVWFGPKLMLVVKSPEDLKIILNADESHDKPLFFYKMFTRCGLIVLNGNESKVHRKAINPVFSPKNLRNYLPIIDNKVKTFLNRFETRLNSKSIDMHHYALDFSIETILAALFGNEEVDENERLFFIKATEE